MLEIITRRPTVSNRRPIVSGPARLPTAKAMRYHGALFALTWKNVVSTSVYVKKMAL